MRSDVSNVTSLVLVLVAFSSLVSMIALTRIDNIVHRELYNYGLSFSYSWAMPYWTMTTLVFAMGWFNIIIAIAFQFYVLLYKRGKPETTIRKEAYKPETTTYKPPPTEEPQEPRPAETREAESRETVVPPVEAEPQPSVEGEEAQVAAEAPAEYQMPYEEPAAAEPEIREEPSEYVVPAEEPTEEPSEEQRPEETEAEPQVEQEFGEQERPISAETQEEFPYTEYAEEETREEEAEVRPKKTEQQEAEVTETTY